MVKMSEQKNMAPDSSLASKGFNINPLGEYDKPKRLEALMQKGGITSCGNSQNCVRATPTHRPARPVSTVWPTPRHR